MREPRRFIQVLAGPRQVGAHVEPGSRKLLVGADGLAIGKVLLGAVGRLV